MVSRRNRWLGVAAAESALIVASALVAVAIVREIDCLFDCTPEQSRIGSGATVLIAAALGIVVAGFCAAARLSGWEGRKAVGRGIAAALVLLAVLGLGSGVATPPAAVLAIACAGVIALRPPASSPWLARVLAIAGLVGASAVVHVVGFGFGGLLLVLAALPAIAATDQYALRCEVTAGR